MNKFSLTIDKAFWQTIKELVFIWYVKKFRKYYTHIDYLPLYNFAEILKGKFEYLYIKPKNRRAPRIYFSNIFAEMNFQFNHLDNSFLRDKATLIDYKSKYTRTKNKRWLNEYRTLEQKLKNKEKSIFNIDDFTSYIEHAFNYPLGSIDTKKISTAKAFKNYQKAINKTRNGNN